MFKLKYTTLIICIFLLQTIKAQVFKSIHQEELENHANNGFSSEDYYNMNKSLSLPIIKSTTNCTLNKIVFGWHPYWSNGLEGNYNWNLLSDLSYFAYEVNPSTGNASSTHSWATAAVIDSALAHGVRVNLCVTLFSSHATFFASTTSQQTLITNLISLVQQRNANGVNIDFESLPTANKADFSNFMINLCNQMHTAIPGSKISMALPSVDWSGNYDVTVMYPYVDLFLIMGYDYYYSGSAQAGPTDPLYTHISGYNYNISKSVTYYLNKGVPNSKLALGLPNYGREWPTSTNTVPSNTTASGVARTYKYVRDNSTGYYTNPVNYNKTMSTYYVFNDGTNWRQCFITDAHMMGRRLDLVNQHNLAGIGIWALGNDDGYNDLWQVFQNKLTNCATVPCSDTIYDLGGPQGNYYNNENITYTISPGGASGVSLLFNSFSVTSGSDTLKIYNGNSVNAPLIGNYTGTNSPGNVIANGNALTLSFKSSSSGTTGSGWEAIWSCSADTIPPSTSIALPSQWVNNDFIAHFTDTDNTNGSGINRRFYQVSDFNGTNWVTNNNRGFFYDNFTTLNNQLWTIASSGGTWTINNNQLQQTDETNTNSNIYAPLNQTLSNTYMYHFNAKIEGTDLNKRFGFHFFCDSASYSNRNNSYFIWFRQSSNVLEIYKVTNNVFSLIKSFSNIPTVTGQWYDIKIVYDRITGEILIYRNNIFIGSYTDSSHYSTNGNYISFRSGNCQLFVDSINVYRTRTASPTILVGSSNKDLRFNSPDMQTKAGKIKSIVSDSANNLSPIVYADIFVDYTAPAPINWVNDGITSDIDTTTSSSSLSANWAMSSDTNTGIIAYWYAIGTAPGDTNIVSWTNNGLNTFITKTGLTLINNTTYYFSVKAQNGAGFFSNIDTSDGQKVIISSAVAASYSWSTNSICTGDSVSFTNQSTNANNYLWNFQGGTPLSSTVTNPVVVYNTPGLFQVQLIAFGNVVSDTLSMPALIQVIQNASAGFSSPDTVYLPNAQVSFNNTSTNAGFYLWNFGDNTNSVNINPVHYYYTAGVYTVSLIASNASGCHDSISKAIWILNNNAIQNTVNSSQISIFPNPFINDFNIEINTTQITTFSFQLFDIYGKQVLSMDPFYIKAGNNSFTLNKGVTNLSSGIYIININTNGVSLKYRIVKM